MHARNIHTVGNISSLTEQEIKTLPIKSPKVETLKHALKSFQQQLVSGNYKGPLLNCMYIDANDMVATISVANCFLYRVQRGEHQ